MIKHQHNTSTCVKYSIEKRKNSSKKERTFAGFKLEIFQLSEDFPGLATVYESLFIHQTLIPF